ncbi:MAG: hydrogenase maturation protease [Caldilineaceae bacterium]|nr:hydrogenase maturation protease [Caldilineaceae bacterium]
MTAELTVELTEQGYLHVPASTAERYFPQDLFVPLWRPPELWLVPVYGAGGGGLLLKRRNLQGDRSALIWEALPPEVRPGKYPALWSAEQGMLRVLLPNLAEEGRSEQASI